MTALVSDPPAMVVPDYNPDQVARLELIPGVELMSGARAPILIVCNVTPIAANHILALVDIVIPAVPFRFVFGRCRWVCDDQGERIETPDGPFEFLGDGEAARFQRTALHAARQQVGTLPRLQRKSRR